MSSSAKAMNGASIDSLKPHTSSSDEFLPGMPVLDDTPAPGTFPISETRLIQLAKKLYDAKGGVEDPSLLAENYRFEFPIIKIGKKQYLEALRTFKFEQTFPDIKQAAYHWRVDPYEPNRVWFTLRATGTHHRVLNLGTVRFQPTHKTFRTPPQCSSYTFDAEGKCTSFTGGYVMDNRVGNSGGLGGLFGIMVGVGLPYPGSLKFLVYTTFLKIADLLAFFTLGVSDKILKRE